MAVIRHKSATALVLGIGNLLLSDEGVGALAAQELARCFQPLAGLAIVDGGTAGIELLNYLHGRQLLIIIDAVDNGQPAGTITRLCDAAVPAVFRQRLSPHQLGLSDLLAAALLTNDLPQHLVLFGVSPGSLATGVGLTAPVAAALPELLARVTAELAARGYPMIPWAPEVMAPPGVWAMN